MRAASRGVMTKKAVFEFAVLKGRYRSVGGYINTAPAYLTVFLYPVKCNGLIRATDRFNLTIHNDHFSQGLSIPAPHKIPNNVSICTQNAYLCPGKNGQGDLAINVKK